MIQASLDPILEGMLGRLVTPVSTCLGFHPLFIHVLRFGISASALGQAIARCTVADAHGDPMEPGAETRTAGKRTQAPVELEKTLLDEVFGVFGTTGRANHKGEHIPTMSAVKFQECTIISRGGASGEIFVGYRHAP